MRLTAHSRTAWRFSPRSRSASWTSASDFASALIGVMRERPIAVELAAPAPQATQPFFALVARFDMQAA